MKVIHETNELSATTKTGRSKHWIGQVVTREDKYYTRTKFWQMKQDGTSSVVQESDPYEVFPLNIGKSNETTAKGQAIFNITSDYNKQIDKGYAPLGEESKVLPLPMLANKY